VVKATSTTVASVALGSVIDTVKVAVPSLSHTLADKEENCTAVLDTPYLCFPISSKLSLSFTSHSESSELVPAAVAQSALPVKTLAFLTKV